MGKIRWYWLPAGALLAALLTAGALIWFEDWCLALWMLRS